MPSCLDLNFTSRLRLPAFVACKSNWWHEYFKPLCFDSIWCLRLFVVVALWSHCLQGYLTSSCFYCICFLKFTFRVDWSSHCLHLYCMVWSINFIMTCYVWLLFTFNLISLNLLMNKTFIIIHILTLFICVNDIFTNLFVFGSVIENVVINIIMQVHLNT